MTSNLNTRARIKRALRNNIKTYSAWETFQKFKWFTLATVILMPIYPSLSVLGSNYEALAGDYDESTIITAYGGDTDKDGSFISANGMIRTDFDTSTQIAKVVKEEK